MNTAYLIPLQCPQALPGEVSAPIAPLNDTLRLIQERANILPTASLKLGGIFLGSATVTKQSSFGPEVITFSMPNQERRVFLWAGQDGAINGKFLMDNQGFLEWGAGGDADQDSSFSRNSSGYMALVNPTGFIVSGTGVDRLVVNTSATLTDYAVLINKAAGSGSATLDIKSLTSSYPVIRTETLASGNNALGSFTTGDAQLRWSMTGAGHMDWGPGSAGSDIFLERVTTRSMRFDSWSGEPRLGIGTGGVNPGAMLDLGSAGGYLGVLRMAGSTSGNVTIQPAVAAGTWTFTLPTSGGTNKYALTTNGSGVTSWAQLDLTAGVTGVLPVANGGTGDSTLTSNGVLYGNGTGAILVTAQGAAGTVLHGNAGVPTFSAVSLTADVSGVLPVANGGTATSTQFTAGSVIFAGASGVYSQDNANLFWDDPNNRLGIGTASPGYDLHVYRSAAANIRLAFENPSTLASATAGLRLIVGTDARDAIIWNQNSSNTNYGGADSMNIYKIGPYPIAFETNDVLRLKIDGVGNIKIAGSATRATTEGTNHLDIFDGTAPVGTLANGISLYSTSGELRVMDAAGNATLLSPHDDAGNWVFDSTDSTKGKRVLIEVEKLLRTLNAFLGTDYVHDLEDKL